MAAVVSLRDSSSPEVAGALGQSCRHKVLSPAKEPKL
jgi:hypothetical protein